MAKSSMQDPMNDSESSPNGSTSPDTEVLLAEAPDYPVFPRDLYLLRWAGIKLGERTPWGAKDNKVKEKCFNWSFEALKKGEPKLADGQWNKAYHVTDDGGMQNAVLITFNFQTGVKMSSKNSNGRKVLEAIIGREVTREEIQVLNLLALQAKAECVVEVFVNVDTGEDGDNRNSIQFDTMERWIASPIDITPYLIKPIKAPF